MFARIVDFVSRPGKTRTLSETIQNKLLPIFRVQPGFIDEIVLESDVEPNRILTLSFWKTREQAERYNQETYPAVKEVLLASLETDPVVRTFNVASSTTSQHSRGQGGLVQPGRSVGEPVTSGYGSQP
jgi:heme-degrading monooxygenase HmoA